MTRNSTISTAGTAFAERRERQRAIVTRVMRHVQAHLADVPPGRLWWAARARRSSITATVAAALGVSCRCVHRARRLWREAPELAERVARGELGLRAAEAGLRPAVIAPPVPSPGLECQPTAPAVNAGVRGGVGRPPVVVSRVSAGGAMRQIQATLANVRRGRPRRDGGATDRGVITATFAAALGVSRRYVHRARRLWRQAPALAERVARRELTLGAAEALRVRLALSPPSDSYRPRVIYLAGLAADQELAVTVWLGLRCPGVQMRWCRPQDAADPGAHPDGLVLDRVSPTILAVLVEQLTGVRPHLTRRRRQALAAGVVLYLAQHYAEPLRLPDVAAALGLSPTHLIECVRRETGVPTMRVLGLVRLEVAKRLLRDTEATLADSARAAGFGCVGSLAGTFQRVEGVCPGAWRRAEWRRRFSPALAAGMSASTNAAATDQPPPPP